MAKKTEEQIIAEAKADLRKRGIDPDRADRFCDTEDNNFVLVKRGGGESFAEWIRRTGAELDAKN